MTKQLYFDAHGIDANDLFSVDDVATLLCCQPQWVYRLLSRGSIQSELISGRHVIRGIAIVDYIDSRIPYGPVGLIANGDER